MVVHQQAFVHQQALEKTIDDHPLLAIASCDPRSTVFTSRMKRGDVNCEPDKLVKTQ